DWDGTKQVPPPPSVSRELVHSTDVLPTALGYALDTTGSQSCPVSGATSCDGKDLRPYVFPASTGGGPSAPLRHSPCGHHTQRPTAPTTQPYLLTPPRTRRRPGAPCSHAPEPSGDAPTSQRRRATRMRTAVLLRPASVATACPEPRRRAAARRSAARARSVSADAAAGDRRASTTPRAPRSSPPGTPPAWSRRRGGAPTAPAAGAAPTQTVPHVRRVRARRRRRAGGCARRGS